MKILFLHFNIQTGNGPHFVPGIASISSVLKAAGHRTGLLFLQEEMDRDAFLEKIRTEAPDLVGINTITNQWPVITRYTRWLREGFPGPVIHGGVHVTVAPEAALACPEVDLLCIGEGEFPVLELVSALERGGSYEGIRNLWLKKPDGQILRNPLRPLIQDLDALPFADRELFNYRWLLQGNPYEATMLMAGRGCPFTCKYCVNNALHQLYRGLGKYPRLRSPERVVEEVRQLRDEYGTRRLLIYDDTFTYDRRWLERFCELYRRELRLPFTVNIRVGTVTEADLTRLRQAGCEMIIVGIESGSERVRREILGRKMRNAEIIRVFRAADRLGLKTWTNNMVGMPTETPAEAEATVALQRKIRPNRAQMTVFYPFPGTDLYARCLREGYLSGREASGVFLNSVLNLPTLSPEQIARTLVKFRETTRRIAVEKEGKRAYYDFLWHFPEAEIASEQADYVDFHAETINGEERLVLLAHPETRITYRVFFPERARLVLGMGLSPLVWSPEKGAGVHFRVFLEDRGQEVRVFSRYLDPKNDPADRRWHDVELDLSAYPPGPRKIIFQTTTDGAPKYYCWANWSHPLLLGRRNLLTPLRRVWRWGFKPAGWFSRPGAGAHRRGRENAPEKTQTGAGLHG